MKCFLLIFALLFGVHATDVPAQSFPASKTVNIAMYGDSTQQGWTFEYGYYNITPRNSPAQVQNMLVSAGYNVNVTNHGVMGTTTGDLINGVNGIPQPWSTEMATSNADIVVVNMGLNDARRLYYNWETQAQLQSYLTQIIQIAQQQGKVVFIEDPNPRTDIPASYVTEVVLTQLIVVEQSQNVIMIDQYSPIMSDLPNWQSHLPDGVHPDDTMYGFKAVNVMHALLPMLTLPH